MPSRVHAVLLSCAAIATAVACGNSNSGPPPSCKIACDTLDSCNVSSSGLSCSDPCNLPGCAQCINGSPCSAIRAGNCGPSCPGVPLTPK